jgi:spore coat polysaccharide biosynthesis protein SpsF
MMLAIVQARTSSTRLPGKVLKPIMGKPMLEQQLDRLARVKQIDKLVVATSDCPEDNAVVELCCRAGFESFRGSLDDVLDRFYQTAKSHSSQHIVRLTGDCPVADPDVIDEIISHYLSGTFDYASNTIEPTYPDGLDAEVFSYECLEQAWREAKLPSQREHVTPFIWQQPERFKLENHRCAFDFSHLRWTVDEPEDFKLITAIYESLYPLNPEFSMKDILNWLDDNPEMAYINQSFERNEGLIKSFGKDREVLDD